MSSRALVRAVARLGIVVAIGCGAIFVGIQYARIIERNIAYTNQIHDVERDITDLQHERVQQLRAIRRLSDPRGAIPEIHDKLHLVSDHEAIIYLKRHDAGTDNTDQ